MAIAGPVGTNWLKLVNSLKAKGVERIGSFNLSQFAERAAAVPFHPIGSAPPSLMAGDRGSAFYMTRKPPGIYILSSLSNVDPDLLAQLELHELMGALGESDADTAKSTALAVINRTESAAERAALIEQFARTLFKSKRKNNALMVAGGFSVGGGGDIDLIHLKNQVFESVRRDAGRDFSSSEFARHFLNVNFEPLKTGNRVTLNYIFRFPATELLSVYIPQGNEAQLVKEISTKLVSIFPAGANVATIEIRPRACRNGESMRVPRPSDADVANIQMQRSRFLLGCKVNPHESMGVSTSGVNEHYAPPNRAGILNYECAVEAPGQSFRIPFSSALGANGVMVKSGTLFTESDSAAYTLFVNGAGRILGARIAYQARRGQKEAQVLQRAQSGTEVTVVLSTPRITMACKAKH